MGTTGSKSSSSSASQNIGFKVENDEQVYFKIRNPVQLDQSLIDRLAEPPTEPNPSRQINLDESVKQKLKSDLKNLKNLEKEVESKVSEAFKEQIGISNHQSSDQINSSAKLMKDLSNLKQKVDEFRVRNSSGMWPEIVSARTSIVSCLSFVLLFFSFLFLTL
ncbi:hypothetical protein DFH28DRAFT_948579 [Melampsora americana]|nr:hypothetical protein DFH28DRAFT_948579 [Melampsora americana]